jgi:hypothetical protein
MAKGYSKEGFDVLFWEVFRGTGRQTGRKISNSVGRQLEKRILDGNSPFRKYVNRFTLPGTFNGAKNKMYSLIDSFYNEYVSTKAMFQKTMYLNDDIDFIERKLQMVERLIDTEVHERSYGRLIRDWEDYKQQSLNS